MPQGASRVARRATMMSTGNMQNFRTTAKIVGAVYLAGFIVGIAGNTLIQSTLGVPNYLSTLAAHSMTLAIGAVLWLMAVAGDVAHGVLMFPVLKEHSECTAIGYLAFRIIDAVFIVVMVLFILLQLPLGNEYLKAVVTDIPQLQILSNVFVQASQYAYDVAMGTLGIAGLILCYSFYKTMLIPRWLAVWGIAGYAIIVCGMISEIMGSGLGLVSSIPGGLWEVFAGVWLIAKGFSSYAV
jgi:hypothetical protein